jgi:hypothetical protein
MLAIIREDAAQRPILVIGAAGVDVSACQCLPEYPTASYLAINDSEGELVV